MPTRTSLKKYLAGTEGWDFATAVNPEVLGTRGRAREPETIVEAFKCSAPDCRKFVMVPVGKKGERRMKVPKKVMCAVHNDGRNATWSF